MAIFDFINKKCVICKRKIKHLRKYINDRGERIHVCIPCSEYAERRAYKKL